MRGMVTSKQLAELLAAVNVEDVARAANVSTKTIYRLRHQQHSPTLDTVEKILAAIEAVKRDAELVGADGAPPVPAEQEVRDAA